MFIQILSTEMNLSFRQYVSVIRSFQPSSVDLVLLIALQTGKYGEQLSRISNKTTKFTNHGNWLWHFQDEGDYYNWWNGWYQNQWQNRTDSCNKSLQQKWWTARILHTKKLHFERKRVSRLMFPNMWFLSEERTAKWNCKTSGSRPHPLTSTPAI